MVGTLVLFFQLSLAPWPHLCNQLIVMAAATEAHSDLPKNVIKRIVKEKLGSKDLQVNKEALLAFSEAAKVTPCLPCFASGCP